jgi:hypothetical protein
MITHLSRDTWGIGAPGDTWGKNKNSFRNGPRESESLEVLGKEQKWLPRWPWGVAPGENLLQHPTPSVAKTGMFGGEWNPP